MIIKDLPVVVYDIECFPNVFSITCIHTELNKKVIVEISERKDLKESLLQIIQLFSYKQCLWCGYNNKHYDDAIINFIFDKYQYWLNKKCSYLDVCSDIFNLSDIIINSEDISKWKKWKYGKNFKSFDLLTMLFSQKLRVGLKEMEITMQVENVDEYEGDFNKPLPVENIDRMLEYNLHDVENTVELLNRLKEQIDLRLGIEKEYGVDVLSKDGMTIGMEILKVKYLEKTGKTWDDIKDLKSPVDTISMKDIILPNIHYNTPVLNDLLNDMKSQTITLDRKGYEKHFLLDDLEISVGVGGIHSVNQPEIIIPAEDEVLYDSDVNSLYPSLTISYEFVPPHLGKEFLDVYANIRTERLEAKRNKQKIKNETLKLALNGESGNLQQQYSWIYSPKTAYQIRMNGQLLLLMLCERLLSLDARLIQVNTDGVLYLIKKSRLPELEVQLKEWEEETKLTLETEHFEKFIQFAINDYIGILEGYSETKNPKLIKTKGMFINYPQLGKGLDCLIIPKALITYFADGTPVEETIKNCKNIHDFIAYQKIGKQFKVDWGETKNINHINRFYYSTDGGFLMKRDSSGKVIKINSTYGVTILNTIPKNSSLPSNIYYDYYIRQCRKIIGQLERVQLKLF